MRNKYLITTGDPDREQPEVECAVTEEALWPTLELIAEQRAADGEDVTAIRVWKLTEVEVHTKAFGVRGLEKL